jgi:DNA modification methylase
VVVTIRIGDVREQLRTLDTKSVQCVVTSPPYFQLRDYGVAGQIGMEATPAQFIETLVDVFREVKRVLRDDGVLFVNLGDSRAGSGKGPTGATGYGDQSRRQGFVNQQTKPTEAMRAKSLMLIPQRFAIAMADDGWIVRDMIIWHKLAPMPESVRDRCTQAWEPIWMFTKQGRYYWDADAVRVPATSVDDARNRPDYEPKRERNVGGRSDGYTSGHGALGWHPSGANLRNVWSLSPEPSREEHYAAYPTEIPRRCILAASRKGDTILDPFLGSGTTALVADRLERNAIGIELSAAYVKLAEKRLRSDSPMFAEIEVSA